MTHYLVLSAPIAPAHRIRATRDDGDTVYLLIDGVIGSAVLACGSDIDTRDYAGRFDVVTTLPPVGADLPSAHRSLDDYPAE